MKRKILGSVIAIMLATLACGLINRETPASIQPGVETIVAATFQALTAAAPTVIMPTQLLSTEIAPAQTTQPGGILISFENISMLIPNGLASGAASQKVPAVGKDGGVPWEVGPAYIKIALSSYPLQGTLWQPEINVYPVEDYRLVDPIVGERLDEIKSILANPSGNLPNNLPFLPFVNAGQDFHAQMHVINFKKGSGIGYVTQFDQAPIPINNQEMFYTFQGLSQDGKYFISATFPISASFLPADGMQNSPTPADGIPMDWSNFNNFPNYMNAIKQKISATDPNTFLPSLPLLDALIQSIEIR